MSKIVKQDTNGVKPLLQTGELGYDNYPSGGDAGRVYVGTGSSNIAIAKKAEVAAVDSKVDTHITRVDNPHGVTKAQVGLGNADNTADSTKVVASAGKLTTARNITLGGDVTGTVSFDGSANVTAVGTLATITDSGIGTFKKVTTNTKGLVTGTQAVTQSDITSLLGAGSISNTMLANGAVSNLSGTNTGDETTAGIKTKLGITTLSGSNTGDQTITLTGDVTGSGTGSFAATLSNTGVIAGTYKSVTVDAKGRITGGTNPTTISGYGITDAYTKTESDTALGNKQNTLVSGTNIKTINGSSILGSGDLVISGGSGSGITVTEYDITAMGTTQFSIPALDDIVIIKCTLQSSHQSVILPTTGATLNQIVEIQCKATNTNNPLFVNTSGSISLYPNQSIKVRFNGSSWERISYDCSINSGYGSSSYFNVDNGSLNLDAIGKGVVDIVTSSSASYDISQLKVRFNQVQIIAIGGGGAGGSGRKGAAGTARSGGAGGGAGGITDITLNTISLGSSLNIVIGAGGTGGLAVTTNSTNGNAGGNGGLTSVTLSGDANGTVIVASGGTGGGGGTTAIVNGAVGSFSVKDSIRGTQQGAGGTTSVTNNPNTPTAATSYVPTGGGAGGGISTSNVAYNGGAGGSIAANAIGSTTTVVAVGGNGGVVDSTIPTHGKLIGNFIATAPGGGAASLVAFGPQSGLSPAYGYGYGCGGSGGGAAVDAVNNSGAGGAGSSGAVILRFF